MDPDATLVAIRELVKLIYSIENNPEPAYDLGELGLDLADQVSGLDEWITRGGFLPMSWKLAKR
jgi:hypothetical protein